MTLHIGKRWLGRNSVFGKTLNSLKQTTGITSGNRINTHPFLISIAALESEKGTSAAPLLIPRRHRLQKRNQQATTISQGYSRHK